MALIVEDGTGKADAESYVSVADADTYVANYLGGDANWDAAADAAKEVALRKAQQYLDNRWQKRWRGERASDVYYPGADVTVRQALEWPRYITDGGSPWWDSDEIPQPLINAQVELAVRALTTDLYPDVAASTVPPGIKSKSTKAGPVESSVEYHDTPAGVSAQAGAPVFRKVDMLVRPLLQDGRRAVRV